MKKVMTGILAGVLTLAGVSVASAHTVLIYSNPAKGSSMKVLPTKITLKFADPLLTLGKRAINRVVVTDSSGAVITTGADLVKGATLTDPFVSKKLEPGLFKVSYRVSAQDGHIVIGAFDFTLLN
jgi:hypothetical protein